MRSQQNHVHLISLHRFPLIASLNFEQAFRYLIDAPSIVKQIAPMSWNYVQAPQDGTLWLEWIPQERNDHPFPSDGYVWGDPEQTYRQEIGGYTVELKVHTIGYRPGHDQFAQHARTRYHFVSKDPAVNAPPPDPSLWIVHFHQGDQGRLIPVQQIPVAPAMQQSIVQRRWLESLGRLERRDFMLHDREHWPVLNLPGGAQMQQPGAYGMNPMAAMHANQNRYPQAQYPQHGGPPAAKRARTQAPHTMPSTSDSVHDPTIEDEENTAMGDFFDHLTPRDISLARYMQHNRWMEEVFSSPYASNRIVPTDLGLGLMGELKGLTDGILEPPNLDFTDRPDSKPIKAKEAQLFTNLKKEQVEEFEKRVEKHLQDGQAELERMKADHAAKMQEWRKVKALTQAENRLRRATWEEHDGTVTAFRLERPATNGHAEDGQSKESVEDVVKNVEDLLNARVVSHEHATLIAKGGLKEKKQVPYDYDNEMQASPQENGFSEMIDVDQFNQPAAIDANDANAAPMTPQSNDINKPDTIGEQLAPNIPSDIPQPTFESGESQEPREPNLEETNEIPGVDAGGDALDELPAMDINDSLMDGMDIDLDVDDPNIGLDEAQPMDELDELDELDEANTMLNPPQPQEQLPESDAAEATLLTESIPPHVSPVTSGVVGDDTIQQLSTVQPQPQISPVEEVAAPEKSDTEAMVGPGDDDMFNDTFDDLGNIEGSGDDGLIDFEAGGLGMEDSAFGDALHGMDTSADTPAADGS